MKNGFFSLTLILAAISLTLASITHAQSIDFDPSVSVALKTQVNQDFDFLKSVTGSSASPLHQEIFGQVDGPGYLQWFEKRVYLFAVDVCGGAGSVACQDSNYPHEIFVTDHYVKNGYPQVARLMTVFHEARHTEDEESNWPHASCPANYKEHSIWTGAALRLKDACDHTEYGSYGSASIFLNNLSKFCVNCSAKTKSDAKLYSDDQIKRITDASARARIEKDFVFTPENSTK